MRPSSAETVLWTRRRRAGVALTSRPHARRQASDPARRGDAPFCGTECERPASMPRRRGDRPVCRTYATVVYAAAPRTRGWAALEQTGRVDVDRRPAHAGVGPAARSAQGTRLPRSSRPRGDRPVVTPLLSAQHGPPRSRGDEPMPSVDRERARDPSRRGGGGPRTLGISARRLPCPTQGCPAGHVLESGAAVPVPRTRGWSHVPRQACVTRQPPHRPRGDRPPRAARWPAAVRECPPISRASQSQADAHPARPGGGVPEPGG